MCSVIFSLKSFFRSFLSLITFIIRGIPLLSLIILAFLRSPLSDDPVLRSVRLSPTTAKNYFLINAIVAEVTFLLTAPRPTKKRGITHPLAFRCCAGPYAIGTPLPARSGRAQLLSNRGSGLNRKH